MRPEHRPKLSPRDAEEACAELFGLAGRATPLPSERDQNFKIDLPDGDAYVLKVFHAQEDPALVEAQRQVFEHLATATHGASATPPRPAALPATSRNSGFHARRHSVYPVLVQTAGGEAYTRLTGPDGTRHLVWLTPFKPGTPAEQVRRPSPALLNDIGRTLGEMDAVLARHPQPAARRTFDWAAQTAPDVIAEHLHHLTAPRRGLVEDVLEAFTAHVLPRLPELRISLIHNDVNDHNLLVEGERVSAVLDFGDMLESYTACEVAHAACYLMLDEPDPAAVAFELVRGYQSAYPLHAAELAAIYELIRLRLALSVTLSAHQQRREPHVPYLSVSEAPAWRLLERLARQEPPREEFTRAMAALGGTA